MITNQDVNEPTIEHRLVSAIANQRTDLRLIEVAIANQTSAVKRYFNSPEPKLVDKQYAPFTYHQWYLS